VLAGGLTVFPLDGQFDVVALLGMCLVGIQSQLGRGVLVRLVGIGLAAARWVVAHQGGILAKEFLTESCWLLCGKDDVGALVVVEVEEFDLEVAGHMRLVVDTLVELECVDLHRSVGAGRLVTGDGESQGGQCGRADHNSADQGQADRLGQVPQARHHHDGQPLSHWTAVAPARSCAALWARCFLLV
jgi:hypothetical protein